MGCCGNKSTIRSDQLEYDTSASTECTNDKGKRNVIVNYN